MGGVVAACREKFFSRQPRNNHTLILESFFVSMPPAVRAVLSYRRRRIPCYSLLWQMNSLLRPQIFPAPVGREFTCKVLKLKDQITPISAKIGRKLANSLFFSLQQGIRPPAGETPALPAPGAPQNPSGKSPAHFALMRASSSRLERATTGKLSRRANGLQASITTRALRRSVSPS